VPSKEDFVNTLKHADEDVWEAFASSYSVSRLDPCFDMRFPGRRFSYDPVAITAMMPTFKAVCNYTDPVVCPRPLDFFTWPYNVTNLTSMAKDEQYVFGYRFPKPREPECDVYYLYQFQGYGR